MTQAKYEAAQAHCDRQFAYTTLVTNANQFLVEGQAPNIAVVDTGAGTIILSKKFASTLAKCQLEHLVPAEPFITAGGMEEPSHGRTKHLLKFVLLPGTKAETTVLATALISNSTTYDVLLGNEFMGQIFGYPDTMTSEFIWRVDAQDSRQMPTLKASIPIHVRGGPRPHRHVYMVTNATDLMDAL